MDKDVRKYQFLKYFRDILIQNPNLKLNINHIYSELIKLGVDNTEDNNIENFFDTWITYFKDSENIDVLVLKNDKSFCNFVNKNAVAEKYDNHLKVYIPLDKEHIELGAKLIFEFLNLNNISHFSKISQNIRFDDIVIRLINENDLKLLMMFVNKMDYIKEGLIPANPFTFNYNGLAMVCDGYLSYNYVISNYILLYLNDKKDKKQLDYISVDEFNNYIKDYYSKNFINKSNENIFNDFYKQFDNGYDEDVIKYLKEITSLIIKSNYNNFSLDDYIAHYHLVINKNKLYENSLNLEETIKYVIEIMIEKYKNIEIVKEKLINYIETGNDRWITKYDDLRKNISNTNFRKELRIFLTKINLRTRGYVEYILFKYFIPEIEDYRSMKKNK